MLTTASQEPSPTASEFRGGTERFGFRFAVAVAIFLRPFVEFLFHQRYEIFRMESLLVGTGLLVLCLGVAWATRNRLSLFIVAVCSVSVLQAPFIILLVYPLLDAIPLRYAVVAGIVCNGLLALLMKRHFLAVLLVFCGTSFLFGLAERIIGAPRISERFPSPPVDRPVVEKGVRPARVIHLILDEYMGPAGFPRDTEGSTQARESIVDTFVSRGFTLYENAYSTYIRTLYSLPSSLDFTLYQVAVVDQMPEHPQRPYRLLSYWDTLGYRFHVYRTAFVPGLEARISNLELRLQHGTRSLLLNATTLPRKAGHDGIRRGPVACSCRPVSPSRCCSANWSHTPPTLLPQRPDFLPEREGPNHPAQAAPRSDAACRRTACGSDGLRPAAASNTARA